MQLIQPPSLQTCKEYKKWTDYEVAIVTRSTVPPAPSIHLTTPRSICLYTKYTHQVSNNASVYFSTFHYNPILYSYAPSRSSTLQYAQSQSSKNAHVYFSNISCHPLIIQSRPGSSRILYQSILQDPQWSNSKQCCCVPHLIISLDYSKILNHQAANNASLCSIDSSCPPIS